MNTHKRSTRRWRATGIAVLLAAGALAGTTSSFATGASAAPSAVSRSAFATENFENSLFPLNTAGRTCTTPLSSATANDACFAQGALVPGVTYSTQNSTGGEGGALRGIGPDFRGTATRFLGTSTSTANLKDSLVVDFAASDIDTARIMVVGARRGDVCSMRVTYLDGGPEGLLSQECGRLAATEVFFEAKGARPIDRLVITNDSGRFEGIDNLSFGTTFAAGQTVPNQFKLLGITTKRDGTGVVNFQVGAAGEVRLTGKNIKTINLRTVGPQKLALAIKPTGKAAQQLRTTGKTTITVKVTCDPFGGPAVTRQQKVALRKR